MPSFVRFHNGVFIRNTIGEIPFGQLPFRQLQFRQLPFRQLPLRQLPLRQFQFRRLNENSKTPLSFRQPSIFYLVILSFSVEEPVSQSVSHTLLFLSYFKNSILFAKLVPSPLRTLICALCHNGPLTAYVIRLQPRISSLLISTLPVHLSAFFQNLSRFSPVLAGTNTGSCVGPQNKIGHPVGCRFTCLSARGI